MGNNSQTSVSFIINEASEAQYEFFSNSIARASRGINLEIICKCFQLKPPCFEFTFQSKLRQSSVVSECWETTKHEFSPVLLPPTLPLITCNILTLFNQFPFKCDFSSLWCKLLIRFISVTYRSLRDSAWWTSMTSRSIFSLAIAWAKASGFDQWDVMMCKWLPLKCEALGVATA